MRPTYLVLATVTSAILLGVLIPLATQAQTSQADSELWLPLIANTSPTIQPNDPLFVTQQWNLPGLQMQSAWYLNRGARDITIAIVDTGVDAEHPEFSGRLLDGRSFVEAQAACPERAIAYDDDHGHGTHVAGIVGAAGNNSEGIAGVAWESTILPVKVMGCSGNGSISDIVAGIYWAVDNGADVVNLSVGWSVCSQNKDLVQGALDYAYERNVVVVAAAGNTGNASLVCPAALNHVISVSATDINNRKAWYSTYNEFVDLAAPGGAGSYPIISTFPADAYQGGSDDNPLYHGLNGTSQATPHVAGIVALMLARNPGLTPDQVLAILENTAIDLGDTGRDNSFGAGLVQASSALEAALDPPGLVLAVPRSIEDQPQPLPQPADYIPGELLVEWYPDVSAEARQALLDSLGIQVKELVAANVEVLTVPVGQEQAVQAPLLASGLTRSAAPNGYAELVE